MSGEPDLLARSALVGERPSSTSAALPVPCDSVVCQLLELRNGLPSIELRLSLDGSQRGGRSEAAAQAIVEMGVVFVAPEGAGRKPGDGPLPLPPFDADAKMHNVLEDQPNFGVFN